MIGSEADDCECWRDGLRVTSADWNVGEIYWEADEVHQNAVAVHWNVW